MKNYLKKNQNKPKIENYIYNRIVVFEKNKLPDHISISKIINFLEQKIPKHLFQNIDYVFIGEDPEFEKRKINAFYRDSAIYTTHLQDNEEDLIDDIVHELAHSIEEMYGSEIYSDSKLENEFLRKRMRLYNNLLYDGEKVKQKDFINPEYSWEFDKFLMNEIGYDKLEINCQDLFTSPYSVTSLREYYAVGFEEFFLGDREHLSKLCPILFSKIKMLGDLEDGIYLYN